MKVVEIQVERRGKEKIKKKNREKKNAQVGKYKSFRRRTVC